MTKANEVHLIDMALQFLLENITLSVAGGLFYPSIDDLESEVKRIIASRKAVAKKSKS